MFLSPCPPGMAGSQSQLLSNSSSFCSSASSLFDRLSRTSGDQTDFTPPPSPSDQDYWGDIGLQQLSTHPSIEQVSFQNFDSSVNQSTPVLGAIFCPHTRVDNAQNTPNPIGRDFEDDFDTVRCIRERLSKEQSTVATRRALQFMSGQRITPPKPEDSVVRANADICLQTEKDAEDWSDDFEDTCVPLQSLQPKPRPNFSDEDLMDFDSPVDTSDVAPLRNPYGVGLGLNIPCSPDQSTGLSDLDIKASSSTRYIAPPKPRLYAEMDCSSPSPLQLEGPMLSASQDSLYLLTKATTSAASHVPTIFVSEEMALIDPGPGPPPFHQPYMMNNMQENQEIEQTFGSALSDKKYTLPKPLDKKKSVPIGLGLPAHLVPNPHRECGLLRDIPTAINLKQNLVTRSSHMKENASGNQENSSKKSTRYQRPFLIAKDSFKLDTFPKRHLYDIVESPRSAEPFQRNYKADSLGIGISNKNISKTNEVALTDIPACSSPLTQKISLPPKGSAFRLTGTRPDSSAKFKDLRNSPESSYTSSTSFVFPLIPKVDIAMAPSAKHRRKRNRPAPASLQFLF